MSTGLDLWFIRFPDGQVLRAPSTEAVRHHLDRGRIPPASRVRRSPDEEWVALNWIPEFADLVESSGPRSRAAPGRGRQPRAATEAAVAEASWEAGPSEPSRKGDGREDRMNLQPIGVRGMIGELGNALDSSLARIKLRVAWVVGLASAAVLVLSRWFGPDLGHSWQGVVWAGAALGILLLGVTASTLITQMTFQELSHTRTARWEDACIGLGRNWRGQVLASLVVIGGLSAVIWLLACVPEWAAGVQPEAVRQAVAGVAMVGMLVLMMLLGAVLAVALLLGPIVVVEEASAFRALRLWWQFLRGHCRRVFLYEALAAALGMVASLPLLVPVFVAPRFLPPGGSENVASITLDLLAGLALTPFITYFLVANLFIYLNLRYEQGTRR